MAGALVVTGCETPEGKIPGLTNNARAAQGVGALATIPAGSQPIYLRAQAHSKAMCERGGGADPYHSNTGYYNGTGGNWTKLGENVGRGNWSSNTSEWTFHSQVLFDSFMASEGHKANILDRDFTRQVVAHWVCGDFIYVTHVFLNG